MLARLNKASRRSIALIWAMAAVFAVAPGVSIAFSSPVGAFSQLLVHTHIDGEHHHVHPGHHHDHAHHHDHGDHRHHDGIDGASDVDADQQRVHVHYDAGCPSVLAPTVTPGTLLYRLSDRIAVLKVEPMQGAPPENLLRPPIA